ncbi:hypothetical protein [Komagataeibacter melaceti]|uniref:hypothetical protein n=1 Tax=Komagataeibacter melaceti TaxID=2766577 RepID=UPI00131481F9|nr:hypothetical protein [Komagataeibacter melaceti]
MTGQPARRRGQARPDCTFISGASGIRRAGLSRACAEMDRIQSGIRPFLAIMCAGAGHHLCARNMAPARHDGARIRRDTTPTARNTRPCGLARRRAGTGN